MCPGCGGDTLWRYPNFHHARTSLPALPTRCFRSADPGMLQGWRSCLSPAAHVENFKKARETVR